MGHAQHQLLRRIFVCITFHWAATRLPTLQLVLRTIADYPTSTTVCIITDQPSLLAEALRDYPHLKTCGSTHNLSHPWHLTWAHREVMEAAFADAANYTLFVYMEDDLQLKWSALQAWAHDESLLAPQGYHRGFVRTEVAQWDGSRMAFDQVKPTSLMLKPSPVLSIAAPMPEGPPHLSNKTANFVHLHKSYMAMWLSARNQLAEWFQAPGWRGPIDMRSSELLREEAAYNVYRNLEGKFYNSYLKHRDSLVVPYDPSKNSVADIAALRHLSNTYCNRDLADAEAPHPFCRIPFSEVLSEYIYL